MDAIFTVAPTVAPRFVSQFLIDYLNSVFSTRRTSATPIEIVVYSSGPMYAQFIYGYLYGSRAEGRYASVGYQNGGVPGYNDVQWSYDTSSLYTGLVLSLVSVATTVSDYR
jgi:hypothetical protein